MTAPAKEEAKDTAKVRSTLIDIGNCIGCRACQVACKQWNDKDGEATEFEFELGFQNPAVLSAKTYTLISFHELFDSDKPEAQNYAFTMRRCLHCLEPACVAACPTTALSRMVEGPVTYDADPCIGCRYCIWACPWGVPAADWDTVAPKIHKCTHCADRTDQPLPESRNGKPLTAGGEGRFTSRRRPFPRASRPARRTRSSTANARRCSPRRGSASARRPDQYVDHIYGEHEAGGTSVLYVSKVPFAKLGFPNVGTKSYTRFSNIALQGRAARRHGVGRAARPHVRVHEAPHGRDGRSRVARRRGASRAITRSSSASRRS